MEFFEYSLLWIAAYFVTTWITNAIADEWIHIKLPFDKRRYLEKHKDKVNPIYKLEHFNDSWQSWYSVFKYELGWGKFDNFKPAYILFYSIFQHYGYYRNKTRYGKFQSNNIASDKNIFDPYNTIEEFYEAHAKMSLEKAQKKIEAKNKVETKLGEINKIFNENY